MQATMVDYKELSQNIQDVLIQLNDQDNPPTEEERQELSEKMMKYVKEMETEAKKMAVTAQANPVLATITTSFVTGSGGGTTQKLEEQLEGMVLTSRADHCAFDDKKKTKLYQSFVEGLPKGQGFQNIHIEDLMKTKANDSAILAAVDLLHINDLKKNLL